MYMFFLNVYLSLTQAHLKLQLILQKLLPFSGPVYVLLVSNVVLECKWWAAFLFFFSIMISIVQNTEISPNFLTEISAKILSETLRKFCAFPQNFHIKRLNEITVFHALPTDSWYGQVHPIAFKTN